jgi:hypothetical protein
VQHWQATKDMLMVLQLQNAQLQGAMLGQSVSASADAQIAGADSVEHAVGGGQPGQPQQQPGAPPVGGSTTAGPMAMLPPMTAQFGQQAAGAA